MAALLAKPADGCFTQDESPLVHASMGGGQARTRNAGQTGLQDIATKQLPKSKVLLSMQERSNSCSSPQTNALNRHQPDLLCFILMRPNGALLVLPCGGLLTPKFLFLLLKTTAELLQGHFFGEQAAPTLEVKSTAASCRFISWLLHVRI